eukprot:scaffold37742_cov45-Phaeocystis_antarctica.AAC.1
MAPLSLTRARTRTLILAPTPTLILTRTSSRATLTRQPTAATIHPLGVGVITSYRAAPTAPLPWARCGTHGTWGRTLTPAPPTPTLTLTPTPDPRPNPNPSPNPNTYLGTWHPK